MNRFRGRLVGCGAVHGYGRGLATVVQRNDRALDAWFPQPSLVGLEGARLVQPHGLNVELHS
jgi:hypothetical protein